MASESLVRIGLAQIDARLGDVAANVERHLAWIERARERKVDLLVFPELSLTGYRLLHLTPRAALRADSPQLARLAEAAGPMAVVAGFVEAGGDGSLYNSAAVLAPASGAPGAARWVHRKLYLPTYGLFQEKRFFRAGHRVDFAPLPGGRAGVLICEDLWHPEPARRLAGAGARLLVVLSAGPGRLGPEPRPASQESWEVITRSTALYNTCWVAWCNRVGWEEGAFFPGGSHLVRPGGELAERAPYLEEHLLVADLDLAEADRLRQRMPLLADDRTDLVGPAEAGQAPEARP